MIGDPVNLIDPEGLDYTIPDATQFDKRNPGNMTTGHNSVTVNGSDRGSVDVIWNYGDTRQTRLDPSEQSGGDLQAERERGNVGVCVTAQGITCEEAERNRWIADCYNAALRSAGKAYEEYFKGLQNGYLEDVLKAGAVGFASGFIWGDAAADLPGGLLGGLFGGTIGATNAVIFEGLYRFVAKQAWFALTVYQPAIHAAQPACEKQYASGGVRR